ncbi:MAG: alpha-amylase family glycosyl hydrolase, partial [Flavisolibacter sp.]
MNQLISTYRIQFHKEFSFNELEEVLPYLRRMGVGAVYASPIFKAVPGTNHGYDGLDPNEINPEIGSKDQLYAISRQLKGDGIQWLQDIVPNHMAFDPGNKWLMDVLEKGPQSAFAKYFDTAWSSELYEGRLMVPFLGSSLEDVIENNDLRVSYSNTGFVFSYYESAYPLQPLSYETILSAGNKIPQAIQQWIVQIPKGEEEKAYGNAWEEMKMQLAGLMHNAKIRQYVDACLKEVNNNKTMLKQVEAQQSYRLCHWQE